MNVENALARQARAKARRPKRLPGRRSSPAAHETTNRQLRRLDLALAILMLSVLALPMLLIVVLVKLTSRGDVLYRQERIGLGGRPFLIYKFRTMRSDAEAPGQAVWATKADPRRTLLGIALRRYALDELPQLFNVLKGDMSLVGPRPEREPFVIKFSRTLPAYNQRHQVLPGLTGWAQIHGWRGDSSIARRLEFDLHYVNHRSLALNLKILLLTPLLILVNPNDC